MSDFEIFNSLLGAVSHTVLLIFFGAVILVLAFIGAMSLIRSRNVISQVAANDARARIEKHYRKGEMFSVIHFCKTQLHDYPNDVVLHWYLALASYAEKDFEVARMYFKKTTEIDPRYEKEVQPFLDKIESEWKPEVVK